LFLPGSVMTLAGGALFGPVLGVFVNLTGATLGAIASFLIARYLAHGWVERKTGGRIKTLMDGVEAEGWRFVAFTRLVPLFPFNLLNYALGLTGIKFLQYAVATIIFMLPGAIAYTYLGYAGREAIGGGEDLIQKVMLALALLAVVAFIPRLIAQLRKKPMISVDDLKSMMDRGDDIQVIDVRTADDYNGEKGYIAQSVNLPLEEIEQRISELDDNLEKTILLVCTTDRRSEKAAKILTRNGFSDVHVVKGGMTHWSIHGYDVEGIS
jgi:uncharacterized membrane protein YdjX (TVP38/TMEM64 family)/rhodanese-related sulfurtransferase